MAYSFNGTNQFLSTDSAVVLGGPVTLSAWYFRKTSGITNTFLSIGSTSNVNLVSILIGSNNLFTCLVNDGVNPLTAQTYSDPTVNVWNHGCGTFSNTKQVRAFWNGINSGTLTSTANLTSQNVTTIGARYGSGGAIGQYADSLIAEVGIWNAALTAAEIASLAKGMTCDKVRPQNLAFYAPLIRDLIDVKGGLAIANNNGATVANHPRVYA
jgi:hypothetical protein